MQRQQPMKKASKTELQKQQKDLQQQQQYVLLLFLSLLHCCCCESALFDEVERVVHVL